MTHRPTWQTWTDEPWEPTLNGTLHSNGFYIGDMDAPGKEDPGYASDLDVANAARAAAAVNALAGVRRPQAVPAALAALETAGVELQELVHLVGRPEQAEELARRLRTLARELAGHRAAMVGPPEGPGPDPS